MSLDLPWEPATTVPPAVDGAGAGAAAEANGTAGASSHERRLSAHDAVSLRVDDGAGGTTTLEGTAVVTSHALYFVPSNPSSPTVGSSPVARLPLSHIDDKNDSADAHHRGGSGGSSVVIRTKGGQTGSPTSTITFSMPTAASSASVFVADLRTVLAERLWIERPGTERQSSSSATVVVGSDPDDDSTYHHTKMPERPDAVWSAAVHTYATRTKPVVGTIAALVTLTADETVNFPTFLVLGIALYAMGSPGGGVRLAGQRFLRLFSDIGFLNFLEQYMKLGFGLPRPPWQPRKARPFYALVGEKYCFPSGHTMRAAYVACIFGMPGVSPFASLVTAAGVPVETVERWCHSALTLALLLVWVAMVAWSRVALAKHFIADTAAGAAAGYFIAVLTPYPFLPAHNAIKWTAFVLFLLQMIVVVAIPRLREEVRAWPITCALIALCALSVPYGEISADVPARD